MNSTNPLSMFMRQPKIYIRLPSQGKYWPEGSIDIPENGELPVYSMTAKDELLLKIPDALMNGQAVVDVIQNCLPNIKNAWVIPNLDLDVILIAIRIATYGHMMDTPVKIGELEFDYKIDLRVLLDTLMNQIKWDPVVSINNDITVFVRPLQYRHATEAALQTFETQKIIQSVNDDKISEEQKLKIFKESFKKLSDSTLKSLANCIERIDTVNGSTDNPEYIKEFINNVDKEIFNQIQNHIENLVKQNTIKPFVVETTDEMRSQGITADKVEIPITFDPSTFFAQGF